MRKKSHDENKITIRLFHARNSRNRFVTRSNDMANYWKQFQILSYIPSFERFSQSPPEMLSSISSHLLGIQEDSVLCPVDSTSAASVQREDCIGQIRPRSRFENIVREAAKSAYPLLISRAPPLAYSPPVNDCPQRSGIARDWTLLFEAHRDASQNRGASACNTRKAAFRRRALSATGAESEALRSAQRFKAAALRAEACLAPLVRRLRVRAQDRAAAAIEAGGAAAARPRESAAEFALPCLH